MSAGKGSVFRPVVKAVWDERYQAIDWSSLRKERAERESRSKRSQLCEEVVTPEESCKNTNSPGNNTPSIPH